MKRRCPRYGLALAYSYRQELGKAEEEFEAAGKLWPHWARPYAALAALYMDDNRLSEAETAIRESLARTEAEAGKGRQHLLLAQTLRSRDKTDEVEASLRLAIAATPDDLLLYEYLGLFLFQQRDRAGAVATWGEGLSLSPSYGPIRRYVAWAEQGVRVNGSSPFRPGPSALRMTDPFLVGGTPFRAYELSGEDGQNLRIRIDSPDFTPVALLVSAEGLLVDVPDIRKFVFLRDPPHLSQRGILLPDSDLRAPRSGGSIRDSDGRSKPGPLSRENALIPRGKPASHTVNETLKYQGRVCIFHTEPSHIYYCLYLCHRDGGNQKS